MSEGISGEKKRWVPLIEPMGSCSYCTHYNQCEELKIRSGGRIRFRCPLQIEVDVEYSEDNREEGWKKEDGEWIWEMINKGEEKEDKR